LTQRRLLLDTNVLLLLIVGRIDPRHVARFRRTRDRFEGSDYHRLSRFIASDRQVVTTPHILTETSNLLGALNGSYLEQARGLLSQIIGVAVAEMRPSQYLVDQRAYWLFGLTDTAIVTAATEGTTVLTDDAALHAYLSGAGVDVINFNHLRDFH